MLASLVPSGDALLDGLRPLLTDELVGKMAASDVPFPEEVLPNTAALTRYRDTGAVPGCLPWNPAEVCALLRWEGAADAATTAMKLFAGWILIRAYVQPESLESAHTEDSDEHAVVAVAESALDLGGRFPELAARFLDWSYSRLKADGAHRTRVRPFHLFGLLLMAAALDRTVPAADVLRASSELDAEERRVRADLRDTHVGRTAGFDLWLLGLAGADLNGFRSRCDALVRRVAASVPARDTERAEVLTRMLAKWEAS